MCMCLVSLILSSYLLAKNVLFALLFATLCAQPQKRQLSLSGDQLFHPERASACRGAGGGLVVALPGTPNLGPMPVRTLGCPKPL